MLSILLRLSIHKRTCQIQEGPNITFAWFDFLLDSREDRISNTCPETEYPSRRFLVVLSVSSSKCWKSRPTLRHTQTFFLPQPYRFTTYSSPATLNYSVAAIWWSLCLRRTALALCQSFWPRVNHLMVLPASVHTDTCSDRYKLATASNEIWGSNEELITTSLCPRCGLPRNTRARPGASVHQHYCTDYTGQAVENMSLNNPRIAVTTSFCMRSYEPHKRILLCSGGFPNQDFIYGSFNNKVNDASLFNPKFCLIVRT